MIAIGIGCRRGASKAEITTAIQEALAEAQISGEPTSLFSIDAKRDEAGLTGAAAALGLPLQFFSVEALRMVEDRIATRSAQAEMRFGIASVSEAAALIGAGRDATLVKPRVAGASVTIAIARGSGR